MTLSIAIISLWRDSESFIRRSLGQFEELESLIGERYQLSYYFYENDSKDQTFKILKNWLKFRIGKLLKHDINDEAWGSVPSKKRTRKLARYRNECLKAISGIDYQYVLVVDSDILYEAYIVENMIAILSSERQIGMITANTVQNQKDIYDKSNNCSYYDSWALIDTKGNFGLAYSANPFIEESDRLKWKKEKIVYVNSAFGGLALLRGSILANNNVIWNGDKGCEHWALCESIRKLGYVIGVDPKLKANVRHTRSINLDPLLILNDKLRLKLNNKSRNNKRDFIKLFAYRIQFLLIKAALKIKRWLSCNQWIRRLILTLRN